ncbi:Mpo1 family 2-hydroxy fatty acid dioxygenase [Thalassotalea fusca]
MKTVLEQLSTYKSVHLNAKNVRTHFFGIPLIIWSIAVLLTRVSFEFSLVGVTAATTLATIASVVVLFYYLLLSPVLALWAFILFGPLIYSAHLTVGLEFQVHLAIAAFIIGWILQFIGHAYEKAKPAFVDDLNQLFIGPLFLIAEVNFGLGFNKELAQQVETQAIKKRASFDEAKQRQ